MFHFPALGSLMPIDLAVLEASFKRAPCLFEPLISFGQILHRCSHEH